MWPLLTIIATIRRELCQHTLIILSQQPLPSGKTQICMVMYLNLMALEPFVRSLTSLADKISLLGKIYEKLYNTTILTKLTHTIRI